MGRADAASPSLPIIRVSGFLIEEGRLLVVRERLHERTHWTLPGGRLEAGETLAQALVREMREETGLQVEPEEDGLLYVCDRLRSLGRQTVDMSFLVRRTGGELLTGGTVDAQGEHIAQARFASPTELVGLGFSPKTARLLEQGFPGRGYRGDFHELFG